MAVRTRHSLSPSDRLDDSRPTRDRSAERNLGSEKEDLAKLSVADNHEVDTAGDWKIAFFPPADHEISEQSPPARTVNECKTRGGTSLLFRRSRIADRVRRTHKSTLTATGRTRSVFTARNSNVIPSAMVARPRETLDVTECASTPDEKLQTLADLHRLRPPGGQ
ncbi:hypothetical protein Bbelb_377320 [Branchiostoma belcheri]|nr:hypothetical protein Bbelb_377320 [Branchiostoma belcheri]